VEWQESCSGARVPYLQPRRMRGSGPWQAQDGSPAASRLCGALGAVPRPAGRRRAAPGLSRDLRAEERSGQAPAEGNGQSIRSRRATQQPR